MRWLDRSERSCGMVDTLAWSTSTARFSDRRARTSAKPSGSDRRMTRPRVAGGAAVSILATMVLTGLSCERRGIDEPVESESGSTPTASPSGDPASSIDVQTHRLTSETHLKELLHQVGWVEAVVLPGGDPVSLELWSGDGHWHAQTTYRFAGDRVSVTQAGSEGLPPGKLVPVRGGYGVRSEGGLYWLERGFTIAVTPGEKSLALQLERIELSEIRVSPP